MTDQPANGWGDPSTERHLQVPPRHAADGDIDALCETLEHELHHVRDPEWDCGNRDVLGRGSRA